MKTLAITLLIAANSSLAAQTPPADLPMPNPGDYRAEGAATHETWAHPQAALEFPNASEITTQVEPFSPAPATRSSFMASWNGTTGANGYLLDVSTSPSFDSYLEGYHDLNVRNVTGSVVTGLNPGTTYYYRVRAYYGTGIGEYSNVTTGTTVPTTGLTIHATFDSSITTRPNAVAIEAMINRAISRYESLFSDPITIHIRFRYATTAPNGTPLPQGLLAGSLTGRYTAPWDFHINNLRADAISAASSLKFCCNLCPANSATKVEALIAA